MNKILYRVNAWNDRINIYTVHTLYSRLNIIHVHVGSLDSRSLWMIARMVGGSGRINTCSVMKGKWSLKPAIL